MYENRVLIPKKLRKMVFKQFHEGHPGIVAMKSLVRGLIWYPKIDNDVIKYVKTCQICQISQAKPTQDVHVQRPLPERT